MIVFLAQITSLSPYDDCDQVHSEARFTNVEAAEYWIALQQGLVASESAWLSCPDGDSTVTVDEVHYWASISKETIFESYAEARAEELDRVARIKRNLGINI